MSVLFLPSCGKHDPFPLEEYEEGHVLSPPTGVSVTPGGKGAGGTVSITWGLSKDDRYGQGIIILKPDSSDTMLDFGRVKYVIEKPSDKPDNVRQVRYEVFRAVLKPGQDIDKLTDGDFVKIGEVEEGIGQFDDNPILGLDNADSWYTANKTAIKELTRYSSIIEDEKGNEVLENTEKGEYLVKRFCELHPGYGPVKDIDNPNYYIMIKNAYSKKVERKTKEIGADANEYWKRKYFDEHIEQYEGWKKTEISHYVMTKEGEEPKKLDCDIEVHKKALGDQGWKLSAVDVVADIYKRKAGEESEEVLVHRDIALLIEAHRADGWEMLRVKEGVLFAKTDKKKSEDEGTTAPADLKAALEKFEAAGVTEIKFLPRDYDGQLAYLTSESMGWVEESKEPETGEGAGEEQGDESAEDAAEDEKDEEPETGSDAGEEQGDESAEDAGADEKDEEDEELPVLTKGEMKLTLLNDFQALVKKYEGDDWEVSVKDDRVVCVKDKPERRKEIFWDVEGYVSAELKEDDGWSKDGARSCFVYEKDGEITELEKSTEEIKVRWESEGWKAAPKTCAYIFEKDGEKKEVIRDLINEYALDDVTSKDKRQWVLYRGEIIVHYLRNAISFETQDALQKLKDDQWIVDVEASEATGYKKYILRKYDPKTSGYSLVTELETKFTPMGDKEYKEYKKALKKQILLGWEVIDANDDGVWFRMLKVIRREYESTREDHIKNLAEGYEYDPEAKEYKRKKNTAQLTLSGLVNDKADGELAKYLDGDEERFNKYFESIGANLKKYVRMTDEEVDEIRKEQFELTKWKPDKIKTTDRHYDLKHDEQRRTITRKVELKSYEVPVEIARLKSKGYVVDIDSLQKTKPDVKLPEDLAKALALEGVDYNVAQDGRVYIPFVRKLDYMEVFKSDHFADVEIKKLEEDGWKIDKEASDEIKIALRRPLDTEPAKDEFDTIKFEAEKEYEETGKAYKKARMIPRIPVEGRSKEDEELRYVLYHPENVQRIARSWQDVGEEVAKEVEDKLIRGMTYLGSLPNMHVYQKNECDRKLIKQGNRYAYRVDFVQDRNRDGKNVRRAPSAITTSVMPYANYFNYDRLFVLIVTIIFIASVSYFIVAAKRGKDFYIRPIAGISAVEEAVGRAAETGKTVMYLPGIGAISDIATLASLAILSRIAEKAATYDTGLISPNYDPIVLQVAQEVIKESYMKAGRPDAYSDDMAFFLSQRQFAYAAGVSGLIAREKPATIFLMGVFFAESLLLAEAGNTVGALQIAGTDRDHQLPFFVTACDYTLIGEELYAAGAYLSRDPKLLGSLKGQDWFKAFCVIMTAILLLGALIFQITGTFDIYWIFRELFSAKFSSPF